MVGIFRDYVVYKYLLLLNCLLATPGNDRKIESKHRHLNEIQINTLTAMSDIVSVTSVYHGAMSDTNSNRVFYFESSKYHWRPKSMLVR